MHPTVVTGPRIRASGREKTSRPATKTANSGLARVFFGVRYLDPKTSRWISADPAMGEYIPQAPINDDAKKRNGNLPGMGGVFNYVNFHVYHYAGNNPVKLIDPDGRESWETNRKMLYDPNLIITGAYTGRIMTQNTPPKTPQAAPVQGNMLVADRVLMGTNDIPNDGPCLAMTYLGIAQSYTGKTLKPEQVKKLLSDPNVFNGSAGTADYVIKAGINELDKNIDTTKIKITDDRTTGIADPAAFATIRIAVDTTYSSSGVHYQQGSNTGELVWDPLHGTVDKYTEYQPVRNIYIERID